MLHSKQTILTSIFWKRSSWTIKRNHSQFDSSKTMHVRGDWIHPCKGLYYVWHPTTSVEAEVGNLTLRLLMSYIYIYIYVERLFLMFLDHTQRRTTVGRTPLDERSVRRRDLYLTTHDTHNKYPCPRWDSNPRSQRASGLLPLSACVGRLCF